MTIVLDLTFESVGAVDLQLALITHRGETGPPPQKGRAIYYEIARRNVPRVV